MHLSSTEMKIFLKIHPVMFDNEISAACWSREQTFSWLGSLHLGNQRISTCFSRNLYMSCYRDIGLYFDWSFHCFCSGKWSSGCFSRESR